MSSSPSPQGRGARIAGRYLVERKLGAGSMGSVYLALDELTRARIALKVIRADRLTPRAVAGLQAEFQTFAALRHPQIARALDFGHLDAGGAPFYTREYVPGAPLPAGPPGDAAPREFLRPVLDLLDALDYMHQAGLLHLDVHAGNLIVADDRRRGAVLIDFGLVRSLEELGAEASWSLGGLLPPEMLSRSGLGPSADLYMAGRLILHRLTGRPSGEAKLPPEIPGWGPRLTLDLERIAAKALDPSPGRRFSSARELRDALARAIGRGARPRTVGAPAERTIGRAPEIAAIDSALSRLVNGASSVLCFTGPGGFGKSRLLAEAGMRARLRGLEVVEKKFSPGPDPGLAEALHAARGHGRGSHDWLEALSAEHGGTPAERARKAADAFYAGEGAPLVLIVDDADLADRESRDLVTALAAGALAAPARRRASRSLCVFAAGSTAPFEARRGVELRRLGALRPRDAARLLGELLGPLSVPPPLLARAAAAAGRSPLSLRRAALVLRDAWGSSGAVPMTASVPDFPAGGPAALPPWVLQDPMARGIVEVLAATGRPCRVDEAAAGAALPALDVRRVLRRLEAAEVVRPLKAGRALRYSLRAPGPGRGASPAPGARDLRKVHARLARHLDGRSKLEALDALEEAHLAAHLIRSGASREGRLRAVRAAEGLKARGLHGHAIDILRLALEGEKSRTRKFEATEALSGALEEAGDHAAGIALLEPFRADLSRLPARRRVRFWRLLGVHYHRAGLPEKARDSFEALAREADPARDVEDLVFADSEIAELCTYRGLYGPAEEACIRGLARLESLEGEFRRTMEIVLRASLGHLKLRRMALGEAREDLRAARELARGRGRTALEAVILNNLGIAERQLNRFGPAKAAFHEAERLLARGGEGRSLVKIACNLAVIAAEEGDAVTASIEVERAERLIQRYPGDRLEFFASYTRGIVAQLLGEPAAAVEAFSRALPAGKKLGDQHLVGFGEVLLAEASLLAGRYAKALVCLRRAVRKDAPPLLRRMAGARLLLVARVLGSRRAAAGASRLLESAPRAAGALPEAWNDLFAGAAGHLAGERATRLVEPALAFFKDAGVPAGARFARAILLVEAVRRGDENVVARLAGEIERDLDACRHGVLRALEPIAVAEVRFAAGDLDNAERLLSIAGGAIVGSPCLEMDWHIELLRARIALRRGDRGAARRHVHRSLHVRELLLELVPPAARKGFLAHPRFASLDDAAARVDRSPSIVLSTARLEGLEVFEGMVGRSTAMGRVFALIDRLRDQEVPVLIRGETGTGKELAARALHATSSRAKGPFLALHSAALPEELFEAELFGHEVGAFTGADAARPGLLEGLAGGTLLLDDVEHLSLASQAKLLQALGSGRARRLGGLAQYAVDVRVLASTSADLSKLVERGAFRADLYFRLRAVELEMPPLRGRPGDLAALARHFVEVHATRLERPAPEVERSALEALEAHDWPGNVRELESVLLRAMVQRSPGEPIRAEDLRALLPSRRPAPPVPDELMVGRTFEEWRREAERAYVLRLFRETKGDLRRMMQGLGVKRTQLYALLRKLEIDPRKARKGE